MAEYIANARQSVLGGQNILFTDTAIPCNSGYVVHREGSGIFTLRGITNQRIARYRVTFGGNIGLPTGGTTGVVSVAIALNGEAIPESTMTETLGSATAIHNINRTIIVDVPRGCCAQIAVRNINAQELDFINSVLTIERIA